MVLGSSSQVPTRCRNHHGAYLRWADLGVVFDPGEGTQRQMTQYGVKASTVQLLCITHFHGDHCLGVPGVVQRLSLDRVAHTVHAAFPASGRQYWQRLRHASIFEEFTPLAEHPIREGGVVLDIAGRRLSARRLDHRVEAFGYRLEEPDGRRMLPEKLAERGIRGPQVGELQRSGAVVSASGQTVHLDEVSEVRVGKKMAFVMDTRPCPGALALAEGVDLLVCESTFLSSEAEEAAAYAHMTAADAARLARDAGAGRLLLTHFSQRYGDMRRFADEAARFHDDVVLAEDGLVVPW